MITLKRFLLAFLILIGALTVTYRIYRKVNTRNEIKKTLSSDYWIEKYNTFLNEPRTKGGIVFFGNSLTEFFNLSVFGDSSIINRGIKGDFTEGLLKRMDEVISLRPSKLFIEIGVNDIFAKFPADEIMRNYENIIQKIQKNSPTTKIYIQSNLPVLREGYLTSCAALNKTIRDQNEQLKKLADKNSCTYINLYPLFEKDGTLNPNLTLDGIHLNKSGYAIWQTMLIPYLNN